MEDIKRKMWRKEMKKKCGQISMNEKDVCDEIYIASESENL